MAKPQYGKVLASRKFDTRADAEQFAKEMRVQYRDAGTSLKYDINRTPDSQWIATIYQKV